MATSHFVVLRDGIPATDMNEMEEQIRDVPGVTSVLSYHAMLGTGIPDFFIPEDLRDMLWPENGGYGAQTVKASSGLWSLWRMVLSTSI